MSDALVLYKSKRGASRQYAEWIAETLKADLHEASGFLPRDFDRYAKIIYCGGLYANSINGIKVIAKNRARVSGKKIIVVACGLSYPQIESSVLRVVNGLAKKLPEPLHKNVRLFLVRGSITYSELRFFENFILKMLENTLRKKDPQTYSPEEKEMADTLGRDFSFVNRESLQPILDYYKTL